MRILSLGLVRGLLAGLAGFAAGAGVTVLARAVWGLPAWRAAPAAAVGTLTGLVAYLLAAGVFTDWIAWARGAQASDPRHGPAHGPGWTRYFNPDPSHKVIGIQYTVASLVLFVIAGIMALLMRLELTRPGLQVLSPQTYNTAVGLHGIVMIAAILVGIAGPINYLVPLMIGARDMAFPRLNALSFWLVPPGALLVVTSLFTGGFNTGWTGYPPLGARDPLGAQFFYSGVFLVGLSSILGAINFLTTIFRMRAPGMTFFRLPIFVWATLATALISLTATQFIAMAFLMVVLERLLGMGFFDPAKGGNPILFQHVFWFYSHPAVYVFVLPGLGIISELLPVFARKPLFGYKWVALSSVAIAVMGFFVWGHHMFTAGLERPLVVPFMITTLLVAVPTGVKFFSWLATLWEGRLSFETPMLFVLGAIVIFLVGGLTGMPNGIVPTDLALQDTWWVVAHLHHTMYGGFVFPFLAAVYFWFPKVTGRMYSERLGKWHFWLMLVGVFLTTLPQFRIGLLGMRRRVADYDAALGFEPAQLGTTVGGLLVGLGTLLFLINLVRSARRGPLAAPNPWRSRSPEWQLSSPPPEENYAAPPAVVGGPYDYGVAGSAYVRLAERPASGALTTGATGGC